MNFVDNPVCSRFEEINEAEIKNVSNKRKAQDSPESKVPVKSTVKPVSVGEEKDSEPMTKTAKKKLAKKMKLENGTAAPGLTEKVEKPKVLEKKVEKKVEKKEEKKLNKVRK